MNTTHIARALSLVLLAAACGKVKDADEQERGQLEQPPFTAAPGEPFALTGSKVVGNFGGSLIVWDEHPTPEQIRAISEASVQGRVTKSDILTFVAEDYLPARDAVTPAKAAFDAMDTVIQNAQTNAFNDPQLKQDVTKPLGASWFKSMADKVAEIDPFVAAHRADAFPNGLDQNFEAYCRAKLVDFGFQELLSRKFVERPTPLQFCEGFYAEQKWFDAPECAPAADAAGKDYFACVWRAIRATGYFNETKACSALAGATAYVTTKDAFDAWTADGGLLWQTVRNDEFREALRTKIVNGGSPISATNLAIPDAFADLKRCRTFAQKKDSEFNAAEWATYKLTRLMAIGEVNDTSASQPYLVPHHHDPDDNDADNRNRDLLTLKIWPFAARIFDEENSLDVSVNDWIYNTPVDGKVKADAKYLAQVIPDVKDLDKADPAFRKFGEIQLEAAKPYVAEKAEKKAAFEKLDAIFKTKQDELGAKDQFNRGVIQQSVDAVNAPGAVVLFASYSLRLEKKDQNRLLVTVTFNKRAGEQTGCVLFDTGAPCDVTPEERGDRGLLKAAALDPLSNKVSVELALDDLTAQGLAPKPRLDLTQSVEAYNDLPAEALQGKTLKIEMYANRLGKYLDFYTGNAWIKDGDKDLYKGSVSGENFSDVRERLIGTETVNP